MLTPRSWLSLYITATFLDTYHPRPCQTDRFRQNMVPMRSGEVYMHAGSRAVLSFELANNSMNSVNRNETPGDLHHSVGW